MSKRALAALAATLCVALPIRGGWAPGGFLGLSGDASAAMSTGTVTIDLALVVSEGTAVTVHWLRATGQIDAVANSLSANDQIDLGELLTRWEWEFISSDREEAATTDSIAAAIVANFESQKGPRPDDYALVFESLEATAGVPVTVGRVLVARDSPGVYSSVAYLDFDAFPTSPAVAGAGGAGSGVEAAETSDPLTQPEAASAGGMTSSRYVVWPEVARLGETVAVLLETQAEVDLYSDGALLNAAAEQFRVVLTDPIAGTQSVTPRTVIESPAALGSLLAGPQSESWAGIVLLFDLPDPWTPSSLSFPADFEVRVDYETYPVFDGKILSITDAGGSPLAAGEFAPLELRPMLRLRPSWEPTPEPPGSPAVGFDPSWPIGALEFTLRYQKPAAGDVANLSALPNGEATGALASAVELAAPVGEKAWKISLVAPEGFLIPDKGCLGPGDCYAGRWSLLDLPLDKLPEGLLEGAIFSPGDFSIEDLRVLDRDGGELTSSATGEDFFRIHAVDNLVDPPPPPAGSGIRTWPTQAYAGDTLAVLFNSEADVDTEPDAALLDASVDNVTVRLDDPLGHFESFAPYAVIELPAALGSEKVGSPPASQTGIVAFFRIPDPWPNVDLSYDPPPSFSITVDYDGVLTFDGGAVTILGTQGALTDFTPVAPLGQLALGPMLRLRPAWDDVSQEGFDPSWEIGGVEFELHYEQQLGDGEVSDLVPVGNGEAIASLALAKRLLPDQGTVKRWQLSLVEPAGLTIPANCVIPGDCYAGRWALLDLRLETQANGLPPGTPLFDANEFSIEAVKVFDRDGVQRNPPYAGEPFFQREVVNVPEPDGTLLLVAGVLGLWGLDRARRRRRRRRGG